MDNPKVKVYVHVSNQIANITNATPFTPEPFVPSASVIRINILWFLSLILSLGSVLIGILCHQWIREYQRDVTHVSYRAAIGIRQIRYQGYVAWYIPQIVSAVPLLLLVSVTLFFVGILDLLHDRNPLVAYIVLAPTSFIIGFLCVTTMLPGIQLLREISMPAPGHVSEPPPMASKAPPELNEDVLPVSQCSFKSPQAWLFQQGLLKVAPFFYRVWCTLRPNNPTADDMTFREALPEAAGARTWINLDEVRQTKYFGTGSPDRYLCEAWKWSHENICQAKEAFYDLLSCYSQLDERSISLVLRTQPERIRGDVYGGEDYSLIQGQLAMPIWLDLWAKSRHYIRSDRLFAPFDREAALLCYLAGKHLPLNLEGSFYPLKAELYDRLFVSLDGQLLAAFEAPMWRPGAHTYLHVYYMSRELILIEPRTTTMVYNISNRGTLFNFEIDDIRWDLDYLKPDERNYLIRKIGDWYLSEYYRTKGRTDQLCRRLIKDYSAGYTSDGWFDLAIDLVQYVLAGSVEGDPGQGLYVFLIIRQLLFLLFTGAQCRGRKRARELYTGGENGLQYCCNRHRLNSRFHT